MNRVPRSLKASWRAFVSEVEGRLAAGSRAYGEASLRASPRQLAGEVEEELLDVAGWGFLLWRRLQSLKKRLPSTTPRPTARKRKGSTR